MRLEWFAFLLGCIVIGVFFIPWVLILSSWWGILLFLAWPAFIWLVSR